MTKYPFDWHSAYEYAFRQVQHLIGVAVPAVVPVEPPVDPYVEPPPEVVVVPPVVEPPEYVPVDDVVPDVPVDPEYEFRFASVFCLLGRLLTVVLAGL